MPVVTDGGRGVGAEAAGTNYPFLSPSPDVKGLLADFWLAHEVRDARLPLRVSWMYGFCRAQGGCGSSSDVPGNPAPTHEADLVVVDADGAVVFDSTTAAVFRAKDWGSRFRLYEWVAGAAACRVLAHTGADDPAGAATYELEIAPADGVLDERAHEVVPDRVTSVVVNGVTLGGEFELVAGYNVTAAVSALTRARRAGSKVVLAAVPGAGDGRYPGCEESDPVVRRVNGTVPDANGNLTLAVGGRGTAPPCLWLERPVVAQGVTATVAEATLRLNDDCGPCCECEDYVDTYRGVRRLYTRFRGVGAGAEAVRNTFRENIDRWLTEKDCRRASPTRLNAEPLDGRYLEVVAGFCNADPDCKYRVRLTLSLERRPAGTGTLIPRGTLVSAFRGPPERKDLVGTWGTYANDWDALLPFSTAWIRAKFAFDPAPTGSSAADSVTVTVTPTIDGVPYPGATVTRYLIGG